MVVAFGVDARHLTTEELTMSGGVAELVDRDIIMDHLVKDRVFDEFFRQVDAGIDAKNEIRIGPITKEPFAVLDKSEFAEETLGMGEFDRYRRECAGEKAGVELIKTGLDVRNRWFQFMIYDL